MFDNVDFSFSRLKSSFISLFVYWANCLELGECSLVRILLFFFFWYSLGLSFLCVRCWLLFVYVKSCFVYSLYLGGFLTLLFLCINIHACRCLSKRKNDCFMLHKLGSVWVNSKL